MSLGANRIEGGEDGAVALRGGQGSSIASVLGEWNGRNGWVRGAVRGASRLAQRLLAGGTDPGFRRHNPMAQDDTSDPTKEEMLDTIRAYYGPSVDEFDVEEAIYWFANFWHGGQGSNLYSVLSTSPFTPGRMANNVTPGSMAEDVYALLESRFVRQTGRENPRHGFLRKNPRLASGATIPARNSINRGAASMS